MKLERLLIVSACIAGTAGLLAINHVGANATRQGDGILAQEPMHLGSTVAPNFIMAIDDSGSMTFQTLFPGTDGEACWDSWSDSFFSGTELRTSGSCNYHYVTAGPRISGSYYGIPPLDTLGFARSPDYNPQYYDPAQTYTPWIDDAYADAEETTLKSFPDANYTVGTKTQIDPQGGTGDSNMVDLFPTAAVLTTEIFRMQNDMVLPKGTTYQTCGNGSGSNCRTWNKAVTTTREEKWSGGTVDARVAYIPATFYLKTDAKLTGYTDPVKIDNACGTDCALYKYEPNTDATRKNFANWFTYYGNRNRAMIAGLTLSLNGVEEALRVGYFTINSSLPNLTMNDLSKPAGKKAVLAQVLNLKASGGTPNRKAVAHIGSQFDTNENIITDACQKNAGMLFTDGYSNDGGPTNAIFAGADKDMGVPFADSHDYTIADIAAYYYNNALRQGPTVKKLTLGKVPTSNPALCESGTAEQKRALDCRVDPHMNFYGITLGAKGKLFGSSTYGPTGAEATATALAGSTSPAWEARTDNSPNTVDEIWHATMNARGAYINARTPAAITTAMRNVLASVGVGAGVSGSLAITGSRLGDSSLSITPRFNRAGIDWYGDVVASKPESKTATDGTVSFTYTTQWTASQQLPAADKRKLFYGTTGTDGAVTAADFYNSALTLAELCANYPTDSCSSMAGADVTALGVTDSEAVKYLAGDSSLEDSKLRKRTQPLGDIINSTPIVSAPKDDHGYTLLRKADGSFEYDPYGYAKYLDAKASRGRMVYVGANDGMLHAFDGETGKETFAYIPAAAVGYMGNLLFPTSPSFQHRYYVDGPVVVSDALFGTTWKTVLVGTSGAGSRSVFGLDVTNPGSFDAADVLWEINDKVDSDVGKRIGYVLGKPVIVPVRGTDGKPVWKAIFGGGYANKLNEAGTDADATRGTVTLFVVDMASGDVEFIDAKETGRSLPNGLGNIVAIDRYQYDSTAKKYAIGSDGMVDTVYGGDLQGNVWKFDLSSGSVALGGKPLFTATDGTTDDLRQPITGGFEAAVGPRGGVMVLFGTGSFSFGNDKENKTVQTAYGVLDMGGEKDLPLTRANLQQQVLGADNVITNNPVNYYSQRGWYLDLGLLDANGKVVAKGERAVGYPKIEGGILYFTSYAPDEGDACSGGGSNYLYGLATLSGGGALGIVKVGDPNGKSLGEGTGRLGLATDGSAPVKDVSVFTTGKQGGLTGNPDDAAIAKYDAQGDQYCMAIVSVAGSQPLYRVRPCGRQSWRQIR